jgi:glutamine---fructose-6-phosphate transaminase (isomerizing)
MTVTDLGAVMRSEIAAQPQVLSGLVEAGASDIRETAAELRRRAPRFVLFAARGTSDHAALYAKYLVELRLGLPAGLASPSTMTAYGARPDLRDVLLVAVSQSGGSPDLVETATVARECGATVLAVTNAPGSALDEAAHLRVDVRAGVEVAVAATKSYTAELLSLWLLLDAWAGGDGTAARTLPDVVAARLQLLPQVERLAARIGRADRLVLTGRGYSYPTAREGALKLMETSYVAAHAFSGADLLHGPLAMVDGEHPVLAVVPDGTGAEAMRPVLGRLSERGADLTVLGGLTAVRPGTDDVLLTPALREDLAPVADIVTLQQLALLMAAARGFDPDRPRGLSKVTETW